MIFRAPEAPIDIPDVALTPFLLERAAARGDKPALIDGPSGRVLTYRAWVDGVQRAASGLSARGFRKGDVLAIYSPNLPEYAVAFHAVSLLGGIVTTISPLYTATELAGQLRDAGARYLLTVGALLPKAEQGAAGIGLREIFTFDVVDGATPFSALLAADGPAAAADVDPRADLVVLPYSSGTTGLPKGVMLTHSNLVANVLQSAGVLGLQDTDTMLGVLPFFHIYGMVVIMNLGLHAGATIVTMPRFELDQCLAIIQKYRVTFANVVPPIVLALAKKPQVSDYDLSSLRTLFSGAAPLGEDVAAAAAARLGCRVLQGYGLTETSPVTHVSRVDAAVPRIGGVGLPVPNTEVKIVDPASGAAVGSHQQGEVCVRGPQVMKGYLNCPEATAAMVDGEGWLHTGDIGYADEDGCLFVVDRVKELIKYKGLQIAPAELEAVLLGHPGVVDAAVIPIPHEEAGQAPKAFVVLRGAATPEQVMRYVAERVAPYKKLHSVEVIDQIPKSPSGKILRRLLVLREARLAT